MGKIITKKKKMERIQDLITVINSFGFQEDKWNDFKKEFKGNEFRFRIKRINISFETKADSWFTIFNTKIIKTTPEKLKHDLLLRGFHELSSD